MSNVNTNNTAANNTGNQNATYTVEDIRNNPELVKDMSDQEVYDLLNENSLEEDIQQYMLDVLDYAFAGVKFLPRLYGLVGRIAEASAVETLGRAKNAVLSVGTKEDEDS